MIQFSKNQRLNLAKAKEAIPKERLPHTADELEKYKAKVSSIVERYLEAAHAGVVPTSPGETHEKEGACEEKTQTP